MRTLFDGSKFEEISERVLLKALLVWVKLRYVVPLKLAYPKYELDTVRLINKISNQQIVAVISDKDIWTIQKNAALFNIVARVFAKHFMTPELFAEYGALEFLADRKRSNGHIIMAPSIYQTTWNEIVPCVMYVKPHSEIIKGYINKGLSDDNQVDIIPRLKSKCDVFLTPQENAIIDKAYNDFKADAQFVATREAIEAERFIEDKHLKSVLKSVNRRDNNNATTKLAITVFTIVDMAYKHDAHKILKIPAGNGKLIMDFTKLFIIPYAVDLEYLGIILRSVIDTNIIISVGKGRILFTTKNGVDPNDPTLNDLPTTLTIKSEEYLDHHFDTHIGHVTSLDDVENIMQCIIQHKYKDYY